MNEWLVFVVGCLVGGTLGCLAVCLAVMAKDRDE